jgi:hypothetical protein
MFLRVQENKWCATLSLLGVLNIVVALIYFKTNKQEKEELVILNQVKILLVSRER